MPDTCGTDNRTTLTAFRSLVKFDSRGTRRAARPEPLQRTPRASGRCFFPSLDTPVRAPSTQAPDPRPKLPSAICKPGLEPGEKKLEPLCRGHGARATAAAGLHRACLFQGLKLKPRSSQEARGGRAPGLLGCGCREPLHKGRKTQKALRLVRVGS